MDTECFRSFKNCCSYVKVCATSHQILLWQNVSCCMFSSVFFVSFLINFCFPVSLCVPVLPPWLPWCASPVSVYLNPVRLPVHCSPCILCCRLLCIFLNFVALITFLFILFFFFTLDLLRTPAWDFFLFCIWVHPKFTLFGNVKNGLSSENIWIKRHTSRLFCWFIIEIGHMG